MFHQSFKASSGCVSPVNFESSIRMAQGEHKRSDKAASSSPVILAAPLLCLRQVINQSLPNQDVLYIFHPPSLFSSLNPLCLFSQRRGIPHALRILTSSATMASPASAVVVLPPMSLVLSPASMAARTASSTILASWARSREYRNIMATERMVPMGFWKSCQLCSCSEWI